MSNQKFIGKHPIMCIHKNIYINHNFIFVNFYTGDNGYEIYAKKLIESLNKFNLSYYIIEINSLQKKWNDIVSLKPIILLKALNKFKKNIIWIDSDAIIEKNPVLFANIKKNIAVHYIKRNNELNSAVLFLKYSKLTEKLLLEWFARNFLEAHLYFTGDQKVLQLIIDKKYTNEVDLLPDEYCAIFDHCDYKNKEIVISQWQASRKLRYVNG